MFNANAGVGFAAHDLKTFSPKLCPPFPRPYFPSFRRVPGPPGDVRGGVLGLRPVLYGKVSNSHYYEGLYSPPFLSCEIGRWRRGMTPIRRRRRGGGGGRPTPPPPPWEKGSHTPPPPPPLSIPYKPADPLPPPLGVWPQTLGRDGWGGSTPPLLCEKDRGSGRGGRNPPIQRKTGGGRRGARGEGYSSLPLHRSPSHTRLGPDALAAEYEAQSDDYSKIMCQARGPPYARGHTPPPLGVPSRWLPGQKPC